MKKVLSVLLALCLIIGAVPMFASAADSDFYIDDGQLAGYNGPGGDIVTPAGIGSIRGGAIEGDNINSVTITEGVTFITKEAIYCPNLKWISIPTSVTYIMSSAFICDNLKDVYYAGSEEQWHQIGFDFNYDQRLAEQATIHFNGTGPDNPGNTGTGPSVPTVGGFTDVKTDDYFADPVVWAVNNGITSGTNKEGTTFSPDATCNRAQIMQFLWRAAGSPVPETEVNPFEDVSDEAYYHDAVLWAVENGITSGTNKEGTTFSPDAPCTRAQAMAFLWHAAGDPTPGNTNNSFHDVPSDEYYCNPVLWAVGKGITSGTNKEGTTFSPNAPCARAQIVTFLYKWKTT